MSGSLRCVWGIVCVCGLLIGCSEKNATSEEKLHSDADAQADTQTATSSDTASNTSALDTSPADVPPDTQTPISADLSRLYCGLNNDLLLRAALRGGACFAPEDFSVAGVLDDAARGFVHGEVMGSGYGATTFGNCDFLACLAAASDCDAAQACEDARWGEPCDGYESRCDGSFLQVCRWVSDSTYRWLRVQDCARMDAACVPRDCQDPDCQPYAACQGTTPKECLGYYGACDGDKLVRCTGGDPQTGLATEVSIDCGELVAEGTCIETPVGGEAPGPTCTHPDQACTNAFAEGFSCDAATGSLSVCLYGQIFALRCADYGYSACADEGFFQARCLP